MSQDQNTTYVFIDSSNLWEVQKSKGRLFDFQKLKNYLKNRFDSDSIKIFYYSAYPADGTRDYNLDGKHKFFTYLKKGLGFVVRKKELKRISAVGDEGEYIKEKGDMDVEITVDVMHHKNKFDTAVFFTGDSDFLQLITYLRKADKKVYIFSSKNNISQELKTGGDGYTDILNIEEDIWGKPLQYKNAKK
jgi:uncharacterized LabA/DUF88 family protein